MSPAVHPTAVVADSVELGEGVQIGPYCVLDGQVRLGDRSVLHSHVRIGGDTAIGAGNEFFPFAAIGMISQDRRASDVAGARLEIGDGNTFREATTVNLGCHGERVTRLGDGNLLMACSHVAHDCRIGDGAVLANCALLAGHVEIGDGAVIGGGSGIHQFVRIGRLAMIGACAKVAHDIPPYVTADGHPVRASGINSIGLRRAGVASETIDRIRELFRICYREGQTHGERLRALGAESSASEEERHFIEFICGKADRALIRRQRPNAR